MLRNCPKCGAEFQTETGVICQSCKKVPAQSLSFRERQVVDLIAKGLPNKEIAGQLHLSEGTIKEYVSRIFRKTGAGNRTELAVWAFRNPMPHIRPVHAEPVG